MIDCAFRKKGNMLQPLNRITFLELKQRKTNLCRKTFYFLSILLEKYLTNCPFKILDMFKLRCGITATQKFSKFLKKIVFANNFLT